MALSFQYGVTATDNSSRHRYIPYAVNIPHVRLNLASETMAELSVPYVSSIEYVSVDPTVGAVGNTYGVVSLTNLLGSRVVAGQDVPRITLYASMEDVELIGAMPYDVSTVTLQAGNIGQGIQPSHQARHRQSSSSITREARDDGLVSNTLESLSNGFKEVSSIPGLGLLGGTADWFIDAAAKSARAFGFSKPFDETIMTRVVRNTYGLDGQVDVPSTGFALSPFQGNKVTVGPEIGLDDEHEMALDFILQKYQYIFHGTLRNTAAISDVIYATPLNPTAFWYRDNTIGLSSPLTNKPLKVSNTLTENSFLPSTLCYVGDNFAYYRGGYKFRFSFAKTKLHGGRLQVSFVPYLQNPALTSPASSSNVVPSLGAAGVVATGYSAIFDLRDSEVFEFEVPFISPHPYLPMNVPFGDLSLVVLAPLKVNASVSNILDFMVEVAALPDFEFAVPVPSMMSPVPEDGTVTITYQSGEIVKVADDMSQQCIGEKVMSTKQIAMMPDYFTQDVANATIFRMNVDPWFKVNAPALATPMATTAQALWFAARSSRMAAMYSFVKGGAYLIVQKETASNRLTHTLRYNGNQGGFPLTDAGFYNKEESQYGSVTVADALESTRYKIPFYSRFGRLRTNNPVSYGGVSTSPNTNPWGTLNIPVPLLSIRNNTGGDQRVLIGRAAADDATMARFIGPPPVIVLNSLSTVLPAYGNDVVTTF